MRLGLVLGSLSVSLLVAVSGWAQEAPVEAPDPAVAPAPAAYPPPPGYGRAPGAPVERTANNSIYAEGLGPGLLYSINYDRTFDDFAGRIGFGYVSLSASSGSASAHAEMITVPITVSYLGIGSKKHMFEVGAGATILHVGAGASTFAADASETASRSATKVLGAIILGYRLQPPDGGFLLRAGLSPIIGAASAVLPWPYLALGGTF